MELRLRNCRGGRFTVHWIFNFKVRQAAGKKMEKTRGASALPKWQMLTLGPFGVRSGCCRKVVYLTVDSCGDFCQHGDCDVEFRVIASCVFLSYSASNGTKSRSEHIRAWLCTAHMPLRCNFVSCIDGIWANLWTMSLFQQWRSIEKLRGWEAGEAMKSSAAIGTA